MGKKIIQFAAILFAAVICLSGVVTAADAAQYRVVNEGGALMLLSPDGQNCGKVQRIFLPADENAVKAPS